MLLMALYPKHRNFSRLIIWRLRHRLFRCKSASSIPRENCLNHNPKIYALAKHVTSNQIFFLLLRGEIAPSKRIDLPDLDKLLATATLTISLSAILSDGKHEDEKSYTVPLRTTAFADTAHLSIRNTTGAYVEYLSSNGPNDILTDYWIPGIFLRTGTWTFKAVAELEDGRCLFAITLTQWLKGMLH